MGAILDDGQEPEAAATSWLEEHPDVLDAWLDGVTTVEGDPGLPAVKEHLGISYRDGSEAARTSNLAKVTRRLESN